MMKFDFDTVVSRKGTDASKWCEGDDVIPMWVADMEFKTSPFIIADLKKRIENGIFGYADVSTKWRESIISWWERRHSFAIDESWLLFSTGVIPSLSSLIRKLSDKGDGIIVLTPCYNIFFHSIENNFRKTVECPLIYKNSYYSIDFCLLEKLMMDNANKMLLLCNPHNPVGRVWSNEELKWISETAKRTNTIVISDEIHCDLTRPTFQYIPYLSVSNEAKENSVALISPTKAFNLAGIQTSAIVCPDSYLRKLVYRSINDDEIAEPNAFAQVATIAAFDKSEEWLNQLLAYLESNRAKVEGYILKNLPFIKITKQEATYLMWLDCSSFCNDSVELKEFLLENFKVYLNDGDEYRGNGKSFLRMNIACPSNMLDEGLSRFEKGILSFIKEKGI